MSTIQAFLLTTPRDDNGNGAGAHLSCADRYQTRFGDVCCVGHDFPIYWAPSLVRDGVFGEGTGSWIAAQRASHTTKPVPLCPFTLLDASKCECS